MKKHTTSNVTFTKEPIDVRAELGKYLRHWPWFILSILIFLVGANIYLRYTPFSYLTTASILIKDDTNSSISQLAMFQDLGLGDRLSVNLENEIEILRSRNLIDRVVRQLELNIQYFSDGRVKSEELYTTIPFRLEVLTPDEDWPKTIPDLHITPLSLTEFHIALEGSEGKTQEFGENFTFGELEYKMTVTDKLIKNRTTRVSINSISQTIEKYRTHLQVSILGKLSSIIGISLISSVPDKSRAVIDELIYQFNLDEIEDRSIISKNTADFIDDRLQIVWGELDSVEMDKVQYKESTQMVDLKAEGSLSLQDASEFNKRLLEARTSLSQVKAVIAHLEGGEQSDLLPANLGIEDSGLINLIQQYNQLVMERNKLLVHATETHPSVINLTKQLVNLKGNVLQSLRNIQGSLDIKLMDLGRQGRLIESQLASIPLKERDFTTIERQQETKQTLYLYLLQKREEASIALAVTEPKAKIVDTAFSALKPVSPKKKIVLLGAIILGGLVPFSIVYLRNILDNKVRSRIDVTQAIPQASILAEIPNLNKKEVKSLIQKNDLSILAESFRVLRTNLQFAGIVDKSDTGKTILVTSSIKGEGKTLVSINLAMSMAHAGSKVLLIGADIRNPRLHKFFPSKQKKANTGLVEYIVYKNTRLEEYCLPSGVNENLDIIHSGAVPPNPAELLMSDRVKEILDEAKLQYDYIILDTAPTLLVTDTLLFSSLVDASLYVIRAGYTQKNILKFAKGLKQEGKLKAVHYVLNDVSKVNYGYGGNYGYGYGYHLDKESFWKRMGF